MIARLTGTLAETGADWAVIDVGGVGYLVQAGARTLSAIGAVGSDVRLLTEMHVREDAITLYAFGSAAERDWFQLLTGVQGVGGRVALAILSVLEPAELARAIAAGDKAMISRANGVGPKLAQRIAMELKDKAGGIALPASSGTATVTGHAGDAQAALIGLGFRPHEAATAVAAAVEALGGTASLDALIRLALQRSARRSG